MPDVGVLQLKISANVRTATESLKTLGNRLAEINKATADFNLGNVSAQIQSIVDTVKGDKSVSTAVKNLGSLLNAISAFSKVTKIGLNKTQINQLSALQTAVSGFNLGNAGTQLNKIREALGGEWNTEQAAKAKNALETLSQGAKALTDSGTTDKIKDASKSLENMTSGTGTELKAMSTEMKTLGQETGRTAQTLERIGMLQGTGSLFGRLPMPFMSMQGSVLNETAGFASSVSQIKEVGVAATDAAPKVEQLLDYLRTEIDYKKGKLAETINNSLGISKPAMSDQAKESLVGVWEGQIQKIEEVTEASERLQERLSAEIDYSHLQEYMDLVTGVSRELSETADKAASVFNIPAMDVNGPFKYASDELTHYTEKLNQAKSDIEFWANEYENIQKRIKYNGETEERTNALGQAEQSFYAASEAAEEYKSRLAELNEYIGKAMVPEQAIEEATAAMSQTDDVVNGFTEIEKEAEKLGENINDAFADTDQIGETSNQFDEVRESVQETTGAINEYNDAIEFARQWNQAKPNAGYKGQESDDIQYINNLIESASKADLVAMRIDALRDKLYSLASGGNASGDQIARIVTQIQSLQAEYDKLISKSEEASEATKSFVTSLSEAMFGAEGLRGAFKRMFPTLSGLLNRFKQLVKYRMLRAIIKQISEGFKEGLENYYNYSKAIGSTFAPAMDGATSSLLQMKNSIGAAAAPLIQTLIPYLQTVVNWFITAINVANQFFSLLGGMSTWSRAVPATAKAFDNVKKSAGGAGAAIKDLLADWDELNIIQSESGGGGGGGGAKSMADYLNMFEEMTEFDQKIKETVKWIKDHMDSILGIVTAIGVAILAWKVSNAFSGFISDLAKLILGGALIAVGLQVTYEGAYAAGYNGGFDAVTFIATAAGILTTAIGGAIIGYKFAGPWGAVIGGATGFVVSIATAVYAYEKGEKQRIEESKWGGIKYTAEQIEEYARSQFTFDIDAEIEVMNANITNEFEAKSKLSYAIDKFKDSLGKAELFNVNTKIDVNTVEGQAKVQALKEAATNAIATIEALQKLIDTNEEGLKFTLTNFKFTDENGVDISEEMISSIKLADKTLMDFFTDLGEQISKWIYEGEKSGWANGEYQMALELMESQQRILDNAEELRNQKLYDLETDENVKKAKNAFATMDYETAKGLVDAEKIRFENYYNAAVQNVETEKESLIYLASLAESAVKELEQQLTEETDPKKRANIEDTIEELKTSAATFENAAKVISDDFEAKVDEKVQASKEKQINAWTAMLKEVYGEDYAYKLFGATNEGGSLFEWLDDLFGVGQSTDNWIQNIIKESGIDSVPKELYDYMYARIKDVDTTGATQFFVESLGGNLFDLVKDNKDLVQNIADGIIANTDNSQMAFDIFKAMTGWDDETVGQYIKTYSQNIWDDATKDIIKDTPEKIDEKPLDDAKDAVEEAAKEAKEYVTSAASEASKSVEETVENVKESIQELPNLKGDALSYYKMVKNAYESGLGEEELKAASAQAFDMYGVDAFLEAYEELNKLALEYKNITDETDKMLPGVNGSNGGSAGIFNSVGNMIKTQLDSFYGTFSKLSQGMPSEITVTEKRDSGEEIGNTAEGIRIGNAELVSGQNTMNGYMQQVASSNANMAENQGTANSYLSTIASLLRTIASQGGGMGGMAQSVAGGMVSSALAAFESVRG